MTFRHWLSRPRPEHAPFGLGVCFLFYSLLHQGTWAAVYLLLGSLAVLTAFTVARVSHDLRRELRSLKQRLPPGELEASTSPPAPSEPATTSPPITAPGDLP